MNSILETINSSRKLWIVPALAIMIAGVGIQQSQAVYAVHDSKVYAQIVEQVKRASEQLTKLKEQYDLQLQNIQNLKRDKVDPITKDIGNIQSSYDKLKSQMSSLITGSKSSAIAFKEQFKDFKNLDFRHTTYRDINSRHQMNMQELEKSNQEITTLISSNQEQLKKSNERIQQFTALIPTTTGEKAISDLNAEIAAENVRAGNIASEIQSLSAKQRVIASQIEKLTQDAMKAVTDKTKSDFEEKAKQLESVQLKKADLKDPMGW